MFKNKNLNVFFLERHLMKNANLKPVSGG